ncbi:MAG: hypothetical protein ACFFAE_20025 [Candidatus Hodarchaeota archaeon]
MPDIGKPLLDLPNTSKAAKTFAPDDIPTRETIELSAWTEEWWTGETQLAILKKSGSIDYFCLRHKISRAELERVLSEPKKHTPSSELALLLCEITKVPLHPYYSFNWNEIAISDLIKLVNDINLSSENSLSNNEDIQIILRQLGVPFIISDEKIHVERFTLFFNLLKGKLDQLTSIISEKTEVIETEQLVQLITRIPIKSLCQRRIGVKVVRVEKAEPRHVTPPAHVLFPIGPYGGSQRDILKTANNPNFKIQATERFCTFCDLETFQVYCPECNQETRQRYICKNEHISFKRICEECGEYGVTSRPKPFNISNLLNSGFERTGHLELERIKGVSYLKNKNNPTPENVIKGILRSKHDIFVYKDGTARFDQTNAPLSHFTPREIHLSLTELKQLGYTHDIQGNDIIDPDQIIELFPYDIIVSKTGGDFLVQLSNFIDDELVCLYNLSPYYRINSIKNLTGSLIVGLSPFSTVAIIGRVIGFTENDVLYAHPFWHQLKTRNCNGDIDSMTLLLDVLINFSFEFIPVSRGGAMDIPSIIYLSDEWETANNYALYDSVVTNLTFYRSLVTNPLKEDLLSYSQSYLTSKYPFEHFNDNISHHSYENLFRESKIVTKIEIILDILRLIRGIEPVEFVDGILEKDILIKITSSMDRFFLQPLRCKVCKTTFRRVPLFEKCPICHNETIGLTLSEGWVLRYFQIINQLKKKYSSNISEYSRSWIELIELNKRLIFDKGPRPTTLFVDQ